MWNNKIKNRWFISLIAISALLLALTVGSAFAKLKLVDLTHKFENGMPVWTGKYEGIWMASGEGDTRDECYRKFGGWWLQNLKFTEHTGTHIDSPAHRPEGMFRLDRLDTHKLIGKCIVMDMRPYVRDRNAYEITLSDVRNWEQKHGISLSAARGGFVYMWTGWDKYWYEYIKTGGKNDRFLKPNFPGIKSEVARYLARTCGIYGFGMDVLSIDAGPSIEKSPAHAELFSHNILVVENLNNLESVADSIVFVIHGPMKIKEGSGAPTRVWAIYDPEAKTIVDQWKSIYNLEYKFRTARMYDLSNYIENGMHIWQGVFGGVFESRGIWPWINYITDGWYGQQLNMNEHTGTHTDSASHRIEGREWLIDVHPLNQFYGPAKIINAEEYGPQAGDWKFTLSMLKDWESKYPTLKPEKGDIIVFYQGWVDEWAMHVWGLQREKETYHFPGIAGDVAKYLVDVGVKGVGTDVTSIDAAMDAIYGKGTPVENNPTHITLFKNGIWVLENVGGELPLCLNSKGYIFSLVCPFIKGGSGGSTRVYYFEGLELDLE